MSNSPVACASSKHDMTTSRKVAAAATRGRPSTGQTTCGRALYAVSSGLMSTTSRAALTIDAGVNYTKHLHRIATFAWLVVLRNRRGV